MNTKHLQVGDIVIQQGAPAGNRYVVVDVKPPIHYNIPRILITEVGGKDLPYGVGEDILTLVERPSKGNNGQGNGQNAPRT